MITRFDIPRFRRELMESAWLCGRVLRRGTFYAIPIPFHFKIAGLRGRFGEPRDHVRLNLHSVFGEKLDPSEIERIAREFHRFKKSAYLWRILPSLRGFHKSRRWPVEGLRHLDEALAKNRGVILLTAHLGYPHLIPRILEVHGYKVRQVISELDRPEKRQETENWLARSGSLKRRVFLASRFYTEMLGADDLVASLDVRPILTALSKNDTLMIAGDGLRATDFKGFHLLGMNYPFPTGFIKLAVLTRAVVLPVFAIPDETAATVRTEIQEPLAIDPSMSVEENLSMYVAVLNEQLGRAPHLWERWGQANFFKEAWKWVTNDQKDPFKSARRR